MDEFDKILDSILDEIEKNPTSDVDKIIATKMNELGLSEQGKALLSDTNNYLNAYDEAYAKLQQAKENGETRISWVQKSLLEIAKANNLSDEQAEQLLADWATESEKVLNKTKNEGE